MNISYNALCRYLPEAERYSPQDVADILTSIGLETNSVEKVESVRGGLKGLVVGEVVSCEKHPNSDHLHLTSVNIGAEMPLKIVCGAPNVATGQKIIVATIGAVLYDGDNAFTIKKSKLRGEDSFGMICSEKEIGIGEDTSGIMVLPERAAIGMPAAEYFHITSDYCLEVDITPNRVDATSSFGVARDLAAYFSSHGELCRAKLPLASALPKENGGKGIAVSVALSAEDCPRYSGITLKGIQKGETPQEIRDVLTAIGQRSVGLVVDISNFVLHECGQPIHIFDADKIAGGALKVQKLPKGTPFTTLDGVERELGGEEIMITDAHGQPLCLAGIFGGIGAEVTSETTRLFIESANFNQTTIRRAARLHGLSTDSSFRFERGLDPAATDYALRRTVDLLQQYAGAQLEGASIDIISLPFDKPQCVLSLRRMASLIGEDIPINKVKAILSALDIEVEQERGEELLLTLPVYRTDVRREADVVEEVLRIYGYNELPLSGYITANLSTQTQKDKDAHSEMLLSEQLVGAGYNEILCNSLSAEKYYRGLTTLPDTALVRLRNPLSRELGVMRQTLLFGGLESVVRNLNNKQSHCFFFEWGNVYRLSTQEKGVEKSFNAGDSLLPGYQEAPMLGLWLAGESAQDSWLTPAKKASVFRLKADLENIFRRLAIAPSSLVVERGEAEDLFASVLYYRNSEGRIVAVMGEVAPQLLDAFGLSVPVFFAEVRRDLAFALGSRTKIEVEDINRFPVVKRDFALLLDETIPFARVAATAREAGGKLLRGVELFDVYQGENLPKGKISYAVRFRLHDDSATLTDKQIDRTMQRIRTLFEKELGASIR